MNNIYLPPPVFKPDDRPRDAVDPSLNFQRANACNSFHALGPRALFEFMTELEGQSPDLGRFMRERMAIYNSLDASHIKTLTNSGGFPPPPLYEVPE